VDVSFAAGILVWLIRTPPKFLRGSQTAGGLLLLPFGIVLPEAVGANSDILCESAGSSPRQARLSSVAGWQLFPSSTVGVVKEYGWLNDQQFLDAVAVAMITPGPVVITVGFIGFLIAGLAGACVAASATFFAMLLVHGDTGAVFQKVRQASGIAAFVDGVTAAAIWRNKWGSHLFWAGGPCLRMAWHLDLCKTAIMCATLGILMMRRKIPEPLIVLGAAIVGLIAYPLLKLQ